jgi:hypothetical protein
MRILPIALRNLRTGDFDLNAARRVEAKVPCIPCGGFNEKGTIDVLMKVEILMKVENKGQVK